jgi:hypothetical protein
MSLGRGGKAAKPASRRGSNKTGSARALDQVKTLARAARRARHRSGPTTGQARGSRIKLNDIDTDARMFVIRNAKAGKDIHLPITPEIAFAISLAVNAEVNPHHEVKETDDLIRHLLMGHAPKRISQDYVAPFYFAERLGDARRAASKFPSACSHCSGSVPRTSRRTRAAAPAASLEMGQTEALEVEDATDSRARARRGNARSLLALQ